MERALRAWDEHLADPSLPRTLAPRMRAAGFEDVAMEGHAFATAEFTPDAYGSALLPLIAAYLAPVDGFGLERGAARTRGARRVLLRLHAVLLQRDPPQLKPNVEFVGHRPTKSTLGAWARAG